jgi:thiamine-monophosphate kinase
VDFGAVRARAQSPPGLRLGPGAEFDVIRAMVGDDTELPADVIVGPGDDCAVLESGDSPWAVTVDMSIEGVHFRRAWLEPYEIGWRSAVAALSDLAAVAAEPVALLVSLALSREDARAGTGPALQKGIAEAGASVGARIVGGDIACSPGPLTLDLVAIGRVRRPVLRDGGYPADELWVTGTLGGAGAAVAAWESGCKPSAAHRQAVARPEPRVKEAQWLAGTGRVRALIDISDGLAGDAGHIAAASGCRALLSEALVPVAEGVEGVAGGVAEAPLFAVSAGEDYELCLAAEAGALEPLREEFQARFQVPLTRVGRLDKGEGVVLEREGIGTISLAGGFSHFEGERG